MMQEIKDKKQALSSEIAALDIALSGLQEALRLMGRNIEPVKLESSISAPSISIKRMRSGTRTVKILKALSESSIPMRPQTLAELLEYPSSKPVRTLLHIAKGKGLVTPSGKMTYVISELGKEFLKKKAA